MKTILLLSFMILFVSCCKDDSILDVDQYDPQYVGNIKFIDRENNSHEFIQYTNLNKEILIFGFAPWCSWSVKEARQINLLDSLYNDHVEIIGVDCDDDSEMTDAFVNDLNIHYTVIILSENPDFNNILFPDSNHGIPKLQLIDKKLYRSYSQLGYYANTVDSVVKYIGK